jgi:acyl transferase domain-containing protein/acyl carrier protein
VDIVVAADHLHDPDGGTELSPGTAALLGAGLVVPQEHPGFRCHTVDVTGVPAADAAARLVREPAASGPRNVAYRGADRLVETLVPVPDSSDAPTDSVLRDEGTYLITGGLGNVGLLVAEHLAATVRKPRLVLLGRSPVPPRAGWAESDQGRRLLALEALGARVEVCVAEGGTPAAVESVVREAVLRCGGFDAVLHAAGLTATDSFQPIQTLTTDLVDRHFTAKVDSLLAVRRATAGQRVGAHLLFSSMSTVLGGLGFAAYAAANSVLDVLAHNGSRTGQRWTSADWDTWRPTADQLSGSGVGAAMAEFSMTVADGLAALDRLVDSGQPRVVVSAGELATRLREWVTGDGEPLDPAPAARPEPSGIRPSAGEYERRLVALWRETLGIEQVGINDNFFDLGGNSLMGLQLVKRIGREFGTSVPAVALFQAPTVAACARYLLDRDPASRAPEAPATTKPRRTGPTGVDPIAVIGMAGRFPGAPDIDRFWANLRDGVESIRFFTDAELLAAGVPADELALPDYVKARPVLDGVEEFDAGFFGYSPKEATLTDPQHRVFLECCWHALENAGYAGPGYRGQVGVFAGTNISTYLRRLYETGDLAAGISDYQVVIGNDKDSLTTAVSYKLDLTGPSMAVQTFCSTSLLAVHLAGQSLRHGECEVALAGGVSIRVPDHVGHRYTEGGMESPDGHVRTFDARAHGSMFGDGAGVVVLKRLADALADRDTVYAVIRGSAVNNDGSLKVGFTAPSVDGQAQVISRALADAEVPPETVSYLEAHGTATELGDPIEVAALTKAFGDAPARQSVAIGSVKTNVGHLDRAAGVSGLIKVALSLRHREIPPSLHFTEPNPEIDFANSPFRVNTVRRDWTPPPGLPRRAGINSLGMGGTNVHVVVEEAPEPEPGPPGRATQLLVLSARTPAALDETAANLARQLRERPELALADVAYTLQVGREDFAYRRLIRCGTTEDAATALAGEDPARVLGRHEPITARPVGLLFAGVGEHYPGMAAELDATEPVFRAAIDECGTGLNPLLGKELREVLFAAGKPDEETGLRALLGRADAPAVARDPVNRTEIAQPAVFAVEYALARLLLSWGVRPDALAGYSVGEYVAATLAGVLTVPDALRLVARRATLIAGLPRGGMLAASASPEKLRPLLDGIPVDLAAVNAPEQCVLAGPPEALATLADRLAHQEIAHRMLDTEHAFHSAMLAPIAEELTEWVRANITLAPPRLRTVSNVSGGWLTEEQATDPGYWARHMCGTVRFADGVGALLADPDRMLVEIGPGQSLGAFVRQHPDCATNRMALIVPTLPARAEKSTAEQTAHAALGRLWLAGAHVDWAAYHEGEARRRVPLPGYPFQRERYWLDQPDPAHPEAGPGVDLSGNPKDILTNLPRKELRDWYYRPTWRQADQPASQPVPVTGPWLIFADGCGVADAVAARITAAGGRIARVTAGSEYAAVGEDAFTVRPNAPEDHVKLIEQVRPRYVLHLWSLDEPGGVDDPAGWLVERGYFSPLWLAKALGQGGIGERDLLVGTALACNVTGADEVSPERATVSGPCKIVPLEQPDITCRQIDIRRPDNAARADRVAGQLLGELAADPAEQLVGWRGNRRWIAGFAPLDGSVPDPAVGVEALREHGVYLITGGLGGIGLAIARGLARTVSAKLVLLGRSAMPPRADWAALANDPATPAEARRRIEAVRDLEAAGAEVLVCAADIAEETEVVRAIAAARERFGRIDGVVHAAGVPGMGLLQFKEHDNAAIALRPKVIGTRVLMNQLAGLELDFIALFSSITSVTGGGPGQVDYCAANSYLDAVAQRASAQAGTRVVAVNWAEWRWNAWGAGLSGYAPEVQRFFADNRDSVGITFDEGWQAFLGVLACPEPQIIVSPQDFPILAELSRTFTIETVLTLGLEIRGRHVRPELGTSYVAPGSELERRIAGIWSDALGIADIGVHDNFFELGGNSLLGVDLIARVRRELNRDALAPHVLYLAPTIGALAEFVGATDGDEPSAARSDTRARGALRRQSLRTRRNRS